MSVQIAKRSPGDILRRYRGYRNCIVDKPTILESLVDQKCLCYYQNKSSNMLENNKKSKSRDERASSETHPTRKIAIFFLTRNVSSRDSLAVVEETTTYSHSSTLCCYYSVLRVDSKRDKREKRFVSAGTSWIMAHYERSVVYIIPAFFCKPDAAHPPTPASQIYRIESVLQNPSLVWDHWQGANHWCTYIGVFTTWL